MTRDSLVLTDAEIRSVTKRKRPSAQVRVLRFMGIAYKIRPDGSLMVLRSALFDEPSEATVQESEINWN